MLKRAATAAEHQATVAALCDGPSTPESAVISLVDSQEFVEFLHQNLLGRASDPGGAVFQLDNLNNGRVTSETLARDFLNSPEAVAKHRNATIVTLAHLGLLDRNPRKSEFDY